MDTLKHESGFSGSRLHFVFRSSPVKNLDVHQYCFDTQLLAEPQATSPTFSVCECVCVCVRATRHLQLVTSVHVLSVPIQAGGSKESPCLWRAKKAVDNLGFGFGPNAQCTCKSCNIAFANRAAISTIEVI